MVLLFKRSSQMEEVSCEASLIFSKESLGPWTNDWDRKSTPGMEKVVKWQSGTLFLLAFCPSASLILQDSQLGCEPRRGSNPFPLGQTTSSICMRSLLWKLIDSAWLQRKKKKLIIFLDIIFNISSCFLSRTSFITPPITPPKTGIKMPSLAMFPTQNVKLSSCVWGVYLRLQDGPVKLTKTKLLAAACQEHLKATSFTCEPACWGWRKVFGCNMDAFV